VDALIKFEKSETPDMNFLAHLLLSFESEDVIVGQFIADEIKGTKYEFYKPEIRNGILLHRFIDHFTDTHYRCLELRAKLRGDLGLYTPVAMDIFFDHALSIHWKNYCNKPLEVFIAENYAILDKNKAQLSDRMKFILEIMIRKDWLSRYKSIEGIELTLNEMSNRLKMPNSLKLATQTLINQSETIMSTFNSFFPILIDESKTKFNTFATNLSENG